MRIVGVGIVICSPDHNLVLLAKRGEISNIWAHLCQTCGFIAV